MPYYNKRGAIVTREIYEGQGHGADLSSSRLRSWFKLRAGLGKDKAVLQSWFEERFSALEQSPTPEAVVNALFATERDPRFRHLSRAAKKRYAKRKSKLKDQPGVRAEARAVSLLCKVDRLKVQGMRYTAPGVSRKHYIKAGRIYKRIADNFGDTAAATKTKRQLEQLKQKLQ